MDDPHADFCVALKVSVLSALLPQPEALALTETVKVAGRPVVSVPFPPVISTVNDGQDPVA
jgi:hypothetical protein